VGGEAISEVLRSRLESTFTRIVSAYGASDLDIGVAGETDFTVAVRRAAAAHPDFAQALFGRTGRLPMVFQYDPSTYYVETIDGADGAELVVTVTRRLLSPRVRYAVHDAGGTVSYRDVLAMAAAHGITLPTHAAVRLPMLFVAGRADSTLSHMGANLYPEDVDAALGSFGQERRELGVGSFCLSITEAADGSTVPVVHVEIGAAAHRGPDTAEAIRAALGRWLVAHNRDWAAAAREDPRALDFRVETAAPGTGVFAANADRIKRRYIVTGGAAA
jgi:phenylacetate-CoA ligase